MIFPALASLFAGVGAAATWTFRERSAGSPEDAMQEAQRLLDSDARSDSALWRKAVYSLGGGEAEANWTVQPGGLAERGGPPAQDDLADGDYVLLLMQHDLQQLDLAQETFADALTTCEESVKEIAPHVKLYDEWTALHSSLLQDRRAANVSAFLWGLARGVQSSWGAQAGRLPGTPSEQTGAFPSPPGTAGTPSTALEIAADGHPLALLANTTQTGSNTTVATTPSDGAANGENVLRLMEHDMVVLQRAENEYANAIGTMERTAAEVKKHDSLYADFVKSIQDHAKTQKKLTLGNSVIGKGDLAEVQEVITMITSGAAFCQETAVHAQTAQAEGLVPPVTAMLAKTKQLWAAAALLEKPHSAFVELAAAPGAAALKQAEQRVEADADTPDAQLSRDLGSADSLLAGVQHAEHRMQERLRAIKD